MFFFNYDVLTLFLLNRAFKILIFCSIKFFLTNKNLFMILN